MRCDVGVLSMSMPSLLDLISRHDACLTHSEILGMEVKRVMEGSASSEVRIFGPSDADNVGMTRQTYGNLPVPFLPDRWLRYAVGNIRK